MSSLGFSLTPEKGRVAYIVIGCTGPGGEHPILAFGSSDAPREGCGKALGIIPTGCQPAGDDRVQTCAQEQFVGLTVRSGRDVNAIGAICDRRDPPPPPPVAKPIHRTGGNRPLRPIAAAPSGPPLAIRTTIQGSWKMTAGEDHYNLILTPSGSGLDPFNNDRMPLGLGGYVIDAERPDAVAGLQGALPEGRVATIAYVMPSGVAGNCQLTYATDGQSLQGSCIVNGQSVTWRGTRGEWPRTPSQNRAAAAGAAAVGGDAGGGRSVTVKLDVDVYAQAGGEGQSIASLNAGTDGVTLVGACKGDWCHVKWAEGDGWVYSGSDYNSLGR